MGDELTPGEIQQRLEGIRHHTELAAEIAVRMSGELSDHIDWLTSELADRDREIEDLKFDLDNTTERLTAVVADYERDVKP